MPLYLKTSDDYDWVQPTAKLADSLNLAQLYEQMGRGGIDSASIKSAYWIWINVAMASARAR